MRKLMKGIRLLVGDIAISLLMVLGIYIVNYRIPQQGIPAVQPTVQTMPDFRNQSIPAFAKEQIPFQNLSTTTAFQGNFQHGENQLETTTVKRDTVDWHQKFSQYFTPTVVATEDSYTSPNLSIHITHGNYDSGLLDTTADGKHEKYGTQIAYTIADVYVGDITCFQTAFAQNIYGNGYDEKLSDMASRLDAVLSVNGDSYNNNRHQNNGTIIRNGVIYRSQRTDMETCVLNWDGSMDIYSPQELNTQTLIDRGAYQSWVFGPSLLDQNGKAKKDFLTWDYITQSHPRTAIGYYEPGHYCFLLVDGREPGYSRGMFLEEEAAIFEHLGCKAAYNLDGGHSSFMTLQDRIVNTPYKAEHKISDGIFIMD